MKYLIICPTKPQAFHLFSRMAKCLDERISGPVSWFDTENFFLIVINRGHDGETCITFVDDHYAENSLCGFRGQLIADTAVEKWLEEHEE